MWSNLHEVGPGSGRFRVDHSQLWQREAFRWSCELSDNNCDSKLGENEIIILTCGLWLFTSNRLDPSAASIVQAMNIGEFCKPR